MQFINCLVKDDKVKNQTKKDYQRNIIPKVINRNKKEIYSYNTIHELFTTKGHIVSYVPFNTDKTQSVILKLDSKDSLLLIIDRYDSHIVYNKIKLKDIIHINYCEKNITSSLVLMNSKMKIKNTLSFSLIDYYYQSYDFICDNETIPLYIIPLLTILIYNKDESSLSRIIHNFYIRRALLKLSDKQYKLLIKEKSQ